MNAYIFVIVLVAVVMHFIHRMAKLGLERRDKGYDEEETATSQQSHADLLRMERRIESLETILFERRDASDPPRSREVAPASWE